MISALRLQNFTVFRDVAIEFGALNVIHGANGTGKTHLLKLIYALEHAAWSRGLGGIGIGPGTHVNTAFELGSTLEHVFACDSSAQLVSWGAPECVIEAKSGSADLRISLDMEGHEGGHGPEMDGIAASGFGRTEGVFLPAAEVLSRDPRVTALFGRFDVREDGAVKDLLQQVHSPLLRAAQVHAEARRLLTRLRKLIGGAPLLDPESGSVYIETQSGARLDAALAAQGHLKLATLALLLERIELVPGLVLCWDEPEANLNPALVRELAPVLVALSESGVQVFLATHSLFLIRELYLLANSRPTPIDTRYIGLQGGENGVTVEHGRRVEDSGDVLALDESLKQAERYLDFEAGAIASP